MFKKILANLPFNPSLIDQLTFYSHRLRDEAGIRRLGFVLMALSLVVQLAAALFPAQNSLAASSNDVLSGISDKRSILRAWDSNSGNIRRIYERFGITRDNIANMSGQQANSTVVSTSANWWSVGRLPLSVYGISGSKWGERSINIDGRTIYQRPLHAWDGGGSSSYSAFKGKNKYGVDFWILKSCGNPTFKSPYLPTPPKPKLKVHKTLLTSSTVKPGDTVKFRLEYRNTVKDSLATNFRLTDSLDKNFEFVSLNNLTRRDGRTLVITKGGELGYSANPHTSTLVVKVKKSAKNNTKICNQAKVISKQSSDTSKKPCVTVIVPDKPPPEGYCVATSKLESGSKNSFTVRTQAYVSGGTKITGYNYDLGGNGTIDFKDVTSETPHERTFSNLQTGLHTVQVYVQLKGANGQASQTAACQAQMEVDEEPRVVLSKSVSNTTQEQNDADGTTVKPGDELRFELKTENVTTSDFKNYQGEDYFGSVLQYAELVNESELASQGMTLDADNYLRWSTANLKAKTTETKVIRVKVKEPIPSTNSPSTVSPDFNCKISNNYGNEVIMDVDCPLVKTVAQGATELPNTGPGTTLAIATGVTVVAGYLFARARIMAKELEIIRNEYVASGGL